MDDEDGEEGEQDAEAEGVEAEEGVVGPDDAVIIAVKEGTVLLEDCLVGVLLRPIVVCCTVRRFVRGRCVGTCCARIL